MSYSPRADAALVEALLAEGIDAEAVAPDELPRAAAAAASDGAACLIPLTAGAAALARLRRSAPRCRILVLAEAVPTPPPAREHELLAALRAGADGIAFVAEPRDVVAPLRALLRGETVLPRRVETLLVESVVGRRGRLGRRYAALGLTAAEAAVCELLTAGRTTAQIAATLGLSPVTVRRHISRAAAKVGARGRTALVAILTAT